MEKPVFGKSETRKKTKFETENTIREIRNREKKGEEFCRKIPERKCPPVT